MLTMTNATAANREAAEAFRLMVNGLTLGAWIGYIVRSGARIEAGAGCHFEKVVCDRCNGSKRISDYSGYATRHYDCQSCRAAGWVCELRRDDGVIEAPDFDDEGYEDD